MADFLAEGRYYMTKRLLEYLEVHSLFETELSLAKETGSFERSIRETREEFSERLRREIKFDTPRVLGMDGVCADSRRRRVILIDIEAGFVLDLHPIFLWPCNLKRCSYDYIRIQFTIVQFHNIPLTSLTPELTGRGRAASNTNRRKNDESHAIERSG